MTDSPTPPPSDADMARQLLAEASAEGDSDLVAQLIAAAAVYARLAALPPPDATLADYDAIDAMLTAAGVPDLIDQPLSARVRWLLEQWRGDNTDQTDDPAY